MAVARGRPCRGRRMIDHLSPRECQDLETGIGRGEAWPRIIRDCFLQGSRLLLGIDRSRSESEIAEAAAIGTDAVRGAIHEAGLWCVAHGLHLLGFPPDDSEIGGAGPDGPRAGAPSGAWRYFMAGG